MAFKLADKENIPLGKALIVAGPDGREIGLFNIEGTIYALENNCPHMGGPLCEGEIEGDTVTCPWHAWQFDIKTAACNTMPGDDAILVPIDIIEGIIYLRETD